jgi:hypothetical protein
MKIQGLRMLVLFCTVAMTTTGCVFLIGLGVGAGTYAYVEGNMKTVYDAGLTQTWEATRLALSGSGMQAEIEEHDGINGLFKGEMADTRVFTVTVSRVADTRTEVAIRIGLGDKDLSEVLHKKIASNLKVSLVRADYFAMVSGRRRQNSSLTTL